jgi:biotin operon repressor
VIVFDTVDVVEEITPEEAHAAGFDTPAAVHAAMRPRGPIHRVALRVEGPDPRIALREQPPDDALFARLDRMGPWTYEILQVIHDRPEVRAGDLAESLGRERLAFKRDVRKLKELGLTISLSPGYRLSRRGEAVFALRSSQAQTSGDVTLSSRPNARLNTSP